jgi:hypothetical protein
VPDGFGAPELGFRQRPRRPKDLVLRLMRKLAQGKNRTYRQRLILATHGSTGVGIPATSPDEYVRVPVNDHAKIVKAEFVVLVKQDPSQMNIEINGSNRVAFNGIDGAT